MLVLDYSRYRSDEDLVYGLLLVLILFLTEFTQNVLFVAVFSVTHVAGRHVFNILATDNARYDSSIL